jgi:2-keto-4-pentenoate hydratase/2-oxohepta-3-ene-1,7-dioic acid hydratase in catechol pathway
LWRLLCRQQSAKSQTTGERAPYLDEVASVHLSSLPRTRSECLDKKFQLGTSNRLQSGWANIAPKSAACASPWIPIPCRAPGSTADELADPSHLDLHISVNGELRQKANTRELILGIPELIEFASSFYTLLPGDVLLSGTPEGVGPIKPGDVMRASIEGVGEMTVHVRAA